MIKPVLTIKPCRLSTCIGRSLPNLGCMILLQAGPRLIVNGCPNTKAELLAQDPTIYNLIDNATYAFPTVLPDACYSAYAIKTSDIITF